MTAYFDFVYYVEFQINVVASLRRLLALRLFLFSRLKTAPVSSTDWQRWREYCRPSLAISLFVLFLYRQTVYSNCQSAFPGLFLVYLGEVRRI